MHYVVTTVHANGLHLEAPVDADSVFVAVEAVLRCTTRAGALVRAEVHVGIGQFAALRPAGRHDVPASSECVLRFAGGREVQLPFQGAPADAVRAAARLFGSGMDDLGPIVGLSVHEDPAAGAPAFQAVFA